MASSDGSGVGSPRGSRYADEMSRPRSVFAQHYAQSRERHAEPGWHEWLLREFARYWYFLGVLALVVFVPLQIEYSLMPENGPDVAGAAVTALAMVAAAVLCIAAGAFGYLQLWGPGALVDRAVARHEEARRLREQQESHVPRAP